MNLGKKNKTIIIGAVLAVVIVLLVLLMAKRPEQGADSSSPIGTDSSSQTLDQATDTSTDVQTGKSTNAPSAGDRTKGKVTGQTTTGQSSSDSKESNQGSSSSTTSSKGTGTSTTGISPSAPIGVLAPGAELKSNQTVTAVAPSPLPQDSCITLTFTHKKMASHSNGQACLKHKNLFTLNSAVQNENSRLNPNSVCVRVNGDVVKHEIVSQDKKQVVIGALAGPNAKVTVRYCLGKAKCTQECKPKKDDFLDALGIDDSATAQNINWDGSKEAGKEDAQAEVEIAALRKDLQADAELIFSDWVLEKTAQECVK